MNSQVYKFPKATEFGRVIPKSKIYEHASPTTKIKELFVQQVEKITWSYKISPETINLPAKDNVQEVQVFTINSKIENLNEEILMAIDKAIPFPILFIVNFENKMRYIAAYKRQNEADKNKWVLSHYLKTDWLKNEVQCSVTLPIVLDLAQLYQTLLRNIISLPARQNETLDALVVRLEQLQIKERDAAKLKSRLTNEKQFNRKVELNTTLKTLKQEIEELKY